MADLIATARAISYTDFRRRVMKAYSSHAAGLDPADDGDPRVEDKLGAYLGQYGEFKFAWFVRFLVDDTPYSHAGKVDLADYCIYLRGLHLADLAADKGDELLPANTSHVLHFEGHPTAA